MNENPPQANGSAALPAKVKHGGRRALEASFDRASNAALFANVERLSAFTAPGSNSANYRNLPGQTEERA